MTVDMSAYGGADLSRLADAVSTKKQDQQHLGDGKPPRRPTQPRKSPKLKTAAAGGR
jgi:hypothetical protein